jgi:large subunit ribosomal protein L32
MKKPVLVKCQKCGKVILSHTICSFCGYYKGREVIDVFAKLDKKEKKRMQKEMKEKEKEDQEIKKKKSLSLRELSKK